MRMALGLGKLEDTIGWLGPPFAAAHTHAPQLIDTRVDVVTISKRLAGDHVEDLRPPVPQGRGRDQRGLGVGRQDLICPHQWRAKRLISLRRKGGRVV